MVKTSRGKVAVASWICFCWWSFVTGQNSLLDTFTSNMVTSRNEE